MKTKNIFTKTDLKALIRIEKKQFKKLVENPTNKILNLKTQILELAFQVVNYDNYFFDDSMNRNFVIRKIDRLKASLNEYLDKED